MTSPAIELVDEMPEAHNVYETQETTVGEFLATIERNDTVTDTLDLDDLVVDASSGQVNVEGRSNFAFQFDDQARDILGRYLKVPSRYLKKCPDELIETNLNFWLQQESGAVNVEYSIHDDRAYLLGIVPEATTIVPVHHVARAVLKPFDESDQINDFNMSAADVHLSVTANSRFVEVPGDGTKHRPKVGDITRGGLTLNFHREKGNKITIEPFSFRLVCSNGMIMRDSALGRVSFRGNSVEEVLAEIEAKAENIMSQMEAKYLSQLRRTAEKRVTGDIYQLIRHVGQEYGQSARIIDLALAEVPFLPEEPTVYDITQLFTMAANQVGFRSRLSLQGIGGDMMMNTNMVTDRCDKCESLLH